MRIYITQSKTATTSPAFPRKGIASHSGRLDVIARMLRSALLTQEEGIRRDTTFIAVLEGPPKPPLTLVFRGNTLNCDLMYEREAVECIRSCMKGETEGCEAKHITLNDVLKGIGVPIILLREDGIDISKVNVSGKSVAFLIGSQHDLELPPRIKIYKEISIGPFSYLASHCIAFLQYYLDSYLDRLSPKDFPPRLHPS